MTRKNTRHIVLGLLTISLTCLSLQGQALPPAFGTAYAGKTADDQLTRTFISPMRVVWKNAGNNGNLVQEEHWLLQPGNSQPVMGRKNMCKMVSTATDTPSILLDYGKELHGGLQLVMGSSSRRQPSLVRIRFGESVGEANSQTLNTEWKVGYSTDDHAKRDIIVEIPRDGLFEIGQTGFRFVRIDLLQPNTTIHIKEARAILRYRDIPYLGSFTCNDERLNQIWQTAAYTVHLNMQEYLWDGIKRDRLIWLGDMHPEVATICRVFGANEVVPASLDLACTQFPLPAWMNNMSAYSLWYLIIHHDWYRQHGDLAFLQRHRAYILGLVAQIDAHIDEAGNENLSPNRFLDWPSTPNPAGVEAGYRALLSWALNDAATLCRVLGEPTVAERCVSADKRLKRKLLGHTNLKQAAALMAISGLMDPIKAVREVVGVNGAAGFSTFYGYYMLEALALAGQHQQALDIIRQFWGGMIDLGATTFWEDFNLEWVKGAARLDELTPAGKKDIHGDFGAYCYPGFRHSLCHGWSSGPAAWLIDHVLGIRMIEPGATKVLIDPHLGDLEWAEGSYPTPKGVIHVRHEKQTNGSVKTSVKAPEGVSYTVKEL